MDAELDAADDILLITQLSVPGLRATQRTIALCQRLGYDEDKLRVVVNRHQTSDVLSLTDAAELLARLEYLKRHLAQEGLFDRDRKKPLPFLPRRIGLVCGRASAAERDVVENARRRWPSARSATRTSRSRASSGTSTSTRRSSARRTCRPTTCRCSTSRSATGRSRTSATSR